MYRYRQVLHLGFIFFKSFVLPSVVDPKLFIPDPDPGKSSGSIRILDIHIIKYLYIWKLKKTHLKFNQKDEYINYLPFSISYYSPTVHKVQNSQRNNSFIYLLFHIQLDPDPEQYFRIRIQAKDPDPQHWLFLSFHYKSNLLPGIHLNLWQSAFSRSRHAC